MKKILFVSVLVVAVLVLLTGVSFAATVTVSGKVNTPDGKPFNPATGVEVEVQLTTVDAETFNNRNTYVTEGGYYRIRVEDLPAGEYILKAKAIGETNEFTDSIPLYINVVGEITAITQDLKLTIPTITGKVLTPDGNVFIPSQNNNVEIELFSVGAQRYYSAWVGVSNDGSFKIGGIPTGSYRITTHISNDDSPYINNTTEAFNVEEGVKLVQDVKLSKPSVTGQLLTPNGEDIIGSIDAGIELRSIDNGRNYWTNVTSGGNFKFREVIAEGTYYLITRVSDNNEYTDSLPDKIVVEKDITKDLKIKLTVPTIIGQVYSPDGNLFTGNTKVEVNLSYNNGDLSLNKWTSIDSKGKFKFGGLPSGDYQLRATVNDKNIRYTDSMSLTVQVEEGKEVSPELRLTNPSIIGKVYNPDGEIFTSWMWVEIRWLDGDYVKSTGINNDGTYKIGGLDPGTYILETSLKGDSKYTDAKPIQITVEKDKTLSQEIKLTEPTIFGKVKTPEGEIFIPEEGKSASVSLSYRYNGIYYDKWTSVKSDGTFSFGGLPSTNFTIWVYAEGFNNPYSMSKSLNDSYKEDEVKNIEVYLTNPSVIGSVYIPEGGLYKEINGTWMQIELASMDNSYNLTVGLGNGRFKFESNIPAGEYLLRAHLYGPSTTYSAPDPTIVKIVAGKTIVNDIMLLGGFAATPRFNLEAGKYTKAVTLTISAPTKGSIVRYTIDGSEPNKNSTLYTSPIQINTTTTIKAKAFMAGIEESLTAIAKYEINLNSGGNSGSGGSGSGGGSSNPSPVPSAQNNTIKSNTNTNKTVNFMDLNNHWSKEIVKYLAQKGIVSGVSIYKFAPNKEVTRAEFAAMLTDALDLSTSRKVSYSDVKQNAWYAKAVSAVAQNGIAGGYGVAFKPQQKITRQEMAAMIIRALKYKQLLKYDYSNTNKVLGKFSDKNKIAPWAKNDLSMLVEEGFINGREGNRVAPLGKSTRAEAATLIFKLISKMGS